MRLYKYVLELINSKFVPKFHAKLSCRRDDAATAYIYTNACHDYSSYIIALLS